jgi:hypothetical protein
MRQREVLFAFNTERKYEQGDFERTPRTELFPKCRSSESEAPKEGTDGSEV